MKELLKKGDVAGPLVAACALLMYWWKGIWTPYHTGVIVLGSVLFLLAITLKIDEIQTSLGRRSTKLGIHSFTSIVLVLGILALVNYLGSQHFKQVDLTAEGLHTLSDLSNQLLDKLTQNVTVKAFYISGDPQTAGIENVAQDSLKRYTNRNPKFAVEFVDPERHPDVAKSYEIIENGTLVLEMGEKKERIQKARFTEEDVTNALQKLVKGEKKVVYFLDGHGERPLSSSAKDGASQAKDKLIAANYTVNPLSLAREKKVPADAAVVVVMGPTSELFEAETDALDEYVRGGGSAFLLLDAPPDTAAMTDFARKWAVDVGNNIVLDQGLANQLMNTGPLMPLVNDYGMHPITERMMRKYTFYKLARSISPMLPPTEGITVSPLLLTSRDSWGESDIKTIMTKSEAQLDQGKDVAGPVTLGVAVNKDLADNKKSRLVIIGDSDFASNSYFSQQSNGELFMNSVAWLSRDESFIAIPPKDPQNHEVTMTESQKNMFQFVVILLFPGAILLTGIVVRASRR